MAMAAHRFSPTRRSSSACDGSDKQFIVALNRADGKILWKTDRKSTAPKRFSFSTPLLIEVNGQKQIISPASNAVIAYDADKGDEIWRIRYEGYSVIPRPVFGHGLVFLSSSYDSPTLLAIKPDGKGDVTATHVVWTSKKGRRTRRRRCWWAMSFTRSRTRALPPAGTRKPATFTGSNA